MTGRLFTTILALAVSVRALAAGYDDFADLGRKPHRRNIRTEWGITAGAHYTGIRLFGQEASMKASPRLGYEAGVHMALRFGDWLALQPEIYYSHTTIDMQADGVDGKIKVKSHAVEFPVLLSLRVLDPVMLDRPVHYEQCAWCHTGIMWDDAHAVAYDAVPLRGRDVQPGMRVAELYKKFARSTYWLRYFDTDHSRVKRNGLYYRTHVHVEV